MIFRYVPEGHMSLKDFDLSRQRLVDSTGYSYCDIVKNMAQEIINNEQRQIFTADW